MFPGAVDAAVLLPVAQLAAALVAAAAAAQSAQLLIECLASSGMYSAIVEPMMDSTYIYAAAAGIFAS
jgi:hypothetical protein